MESVLETSNPIASQKPRLGQVYLMLPLQEEGDVLLGDWGISFDDGKSEHIKQHFQASCSHIDRLIILTRLESW